MAQLEELRAFLREVPEYQRTELQRLLGDCPGNAPDQLCARFLELREGLFEKQFPDLSYKQLVTDVADRIHIDWPALLRSGSWHELSSAQIASAVVLKLFADLQQRLPAEARASIGDEYRGRNNFAVLELMQRSSFVADPNHIFTWVMACIALDTLASLTGAELPSHHGDLPAAIWSALGQAGLSALAGGWGLGQPEWGRLLSGVVHVAYLVPLRA